MFHAKLSARQLLKLPKTPRPYSKQNSRDKHDFCDLYISANVKRRAFLRGTWRLPKKVCTILGSCFFVDAEFLA